MALFLKYVLSSALFGYISWWNEKNAQSWFGYIVRKVMFRYACFMLLLFAMLFRLRIGDGMVGKRKTTGKVPLWSFVVFWPFHCTNYAYLYLSKYTFRLKVENATEILPNWWIGGCFAYTVEADIGAWYAVVDLTTEFPERCSTKRYLNIPTWDGNAPSAENIEKAALHIVKNVEHGPTLCHCAFGVGRSTTIMCAALVAGGKARNYTDAFHIIKRKRKVVRLNSQMKAALTNWQIWRQKKR